MSKELRVETYKAAFDALEETNLCTKHMEYHGQKSKDCTPQKRVLIKVKEDEVKNV